MKKTLTKECDKLLSNTLVAYELNNGFDKDKYFNFVANVKDDFYQEAQSLRFYVYGDKNSQKFVNILKDKLVENGFNVVDINNKNIINIKLTSSDNIFKKQSIVTINLDLRVTHGLVTLGAKSFLLKERLKNSKESIYTTAAMHFGEDIQKDGIDKILGIGK